VDVTKIDGCTIGICDVKVSVLALTLRKIGKITQEDGLPSGK
jgi:hypothetical protein